MRVSRRNFLSVTAASIGAGALMPALAFADEKRPGITREYIDGHYGQLHLTIGKPTHKKALMAAMLKPPLVMMHQSPLSAEMFYNFIPQLAKTRVIVAVDTPGYGNSDRPKERPDLGGYCAAIIEPVIKKFGPEVDLLGYHTGAGLAPYIAANYPDNVRKMILISVPYFAEDRRKSILASIGEESKYQEDGSHILDMWKGSYRVKPEGQTIDDIARIVIDKQKVGRYGGWALEALLAVDLTDSFASISQPSLVVAPHDGLQNQSFAAHKLLQNGQLIDAPDLAYGLFDAVPLRLTKVVNQFLD